MTTIALTKSKHLLPYAAILHEHGIAVSPLLKRTNLPVNCFDDPNLLFPAICGGPFRELVARKTGLSNISLEACRHLEVGNLSFGKALLKEPTVAAAIHSFCRLVVSETSNADFNLHLRPDGDIWFDAKIQTFATSGQWHVILYVLAWMLKIVQLGDPTWSPATIFIGSKSMHEHFEAIEMLGSKALLEQNATGFLVPASILALPVRNDAKKGGVTSAYNETKLYAETYSQSIKHLIQSYSSEVWLDINQISEVIDTSVRTLQRRLSNERETYSNVIQQCRAEMAGDLLEKTDAAISDIARDLGYKNSSHFTRAFRRWAKLTPTQFRKYRSMTNDH